MFKISPIQDKHQQSRLAASVGIPYLEDAFAYMMVDCESGELLGMSQFEIQSGCGYIRHLAQAPQKDDFEAMFILGRSTMNFIDLCGAHFCRAAADAAPERLMKCIGFSREANGEYAVDMTGMFDGHCSGKPVDLAK